MEHEAGRSSVSRLGILIALPHEARSMLGRRAPIGAVSELSEGTLVAVSGLGAIAAERAARDLADSGARALLSWGTAGGLDRRLVAGDLLLPTTIIEASGARYVVDADWHARLMRQLREVATIASGCLLDAAAPLATIAAKREAFRLHAADAVDMETAAIARFAVSRNIPFAAIRVVIDSADESLPIAVQRAVDVNGQVKPAALAGALLRRPQEIVGLLRTGRHFAAAERTLKAVAALGRPQMFWAPSALAVAA